jgi:hypothetical protein
MQLQSLKKYITANNMSEDEYVRWLCLLEGVEFVSKRVEQIKRRSNTVGTAEIDWVKPLAFQKYIEERFESMKSDLYEIEKQEHSLNN